VGTNYGSSEIIYYDLLFVCRFCRKSIFLAAMNVIRIGVDMLKSKRSVFFVLSTFYFGCVFSAQPFIPDQFHGLWGDIRVGCANSPLDNDTGFKIEPRKYIAHEQVCHLVSILKSEKRSLTAKFKCQEEGETYEQVKTFNISQSGNFFISGEIKYIRCDEKQ